jgi:hypothetical protein
VRSTALRRCFEPLRGAAHAPLNKCFGASYNSGMIKQPFGKTGFNVTPLGFGAAPSAYLAADQDLAAKVINLLLDAGVNLIDTAASYPGRKVFSASNWTIAARILCWSANAGKESPKATRRRGPPRRLRQRWIGLCGNCEPIMWT